MAKRSAKTGPSDPVMVRPFSGVVLDGLMLNAKSVHGVEVRLAVRQVEDDNAPPICDDLAAVHDYTGRRVRVTIEALD